jgi:mono/diheme cytochrome c family protein
MSHYCGYCVNNCTSQERSLAATLAYAGHAPSTSTTVQYCLQSGLLSRTLSPRSLAAFGGGTIPFFLKECVGPLDRRSGDLTSTNLLIIPRSSAMVFAFFSRMKIVVATGVSLALIVGAATAWRLVDRDPEITAQDVRPTPELLARGEYLARAADCAACHNAPGGKPFAGGVPFKLPFGTIYSTNITADPKTGIGVWSDDDFVRALHRGVAKDGRNLYPAFPYTSYTRMARDDAVAIKVYLFSLPAVEAPPRPDELIFPFNQRRLMALWNVVFLDPHRFRLDPTLSGRENRGAYLATALGHCGECHTPRNFAFAMDDSRQLAGAQVEGWHAYDITSDKTFGLGGWSDHQIAQYLSTGHAQDRGSAAGPMGEAVSNSLKYLTSEDVAALVSYLRRVAPQPGLIAAGPAHLAVHPGAEEEADGLGQDNGLGKRVFEENCTGCHLWNGRGRQNRYADLLGSEAVADPRGTNLTQVILSGADLRCVHPGVLMPAFAGGLSDDDVAAVSNYLIRRFGDKAGIVSANAVHRSRRNQP